MCGTTSKCVVDSVVFTPTQTTGDTFQATVSVNYDFSYAGQDSDLTNVLQTDSYLNAVNFIVGGNSTGSSPPQPMPLASGTCTAAPPSGAVSNMPPPAMHPPPLTSLLAKADRDQIVAQADFLLTMSISFKTWSSGVGTVLDKSLVSLAFSRAFCTLVLCDPSQIDYRVTLNGFGPSGQLVIRRTTMSQEAQNTYPGKDLVAFPITVFSYEGARTSFNEELCAFYDHFVDPTTNQNYHDSVACDTFSPGRPSTPSPCQSFDSSTGTPGTCAFADSVFLQALQTAGFLMDTFASETQPFIWLQEGTTSPYIP
jgi:hypothetical protein